MNTWVAWGETDDEPVVIDVKYEWELDKLDDAGIEKNTGSPQMASGVFAEIGALPEGALITEEGLARMFGKCTASIKNAVERGELPRPVRLMGKNTWTAGGIVLHHQERLAAVAKVFAKLRN